MEIKDLEIFMKVYEYQNMTKAAQELFLSPQSVGNTILKLENEFNVISRFQLRKLLCSEQTQ